MGRPSPAGRTAWAIPLSSSTLTDKASVVSQPDRRTTGLQPSRRLANKSSFRVIGDAVATFYIMDAHASGVRRIGQEAMASTTLSRNFQATLPVPLSPFPYSIGIQAEWTGRLSSSPHSPRASPQSD
jgi:hypothetical protein